jgi:hypothetical protein
MAPKYKTAEERREARLQSKREHYQRSIVITPSLSRYSMYFILFLLAIRLWNRQSLELVGGCIAILMMYVFP